MNLPIADGVMVRRRTAQLLGRHRRALSVVLILHTVAAVAGLAGPWLLGHLVDSLASGTTATAVDQAIAILAVAVVIQGITVRYAQRSSMVFGQEVFADLRERFLDAVVRLPLSTVERAGTGDLLARTTGDIERVQEVVQFGLPRALVLVATILLTIGASIFASPLVSMGLVAVLPILIPAVRSYLKKATPAYLKQAASWATVGGAVTETVEGVRTVDALGIGARRRQRLDDALTDAMHKEAATLRLRTILFPQVDGSFFLGVLVPLLWGAWLVGEGRATAGAVTTVAVYAMAMMDPLGELLYWIDHVQVGQASLARILGVEEVTPDRTAGDARPTDEHLVVTDVRYAYREGHDVLHGISLDLRPGERLAIVGPSGAGKSTLGRMLAGIHPPRAGSVTVGGVDLVDLPLDELRHHVALVTQEQHVFFGSVAENLRLAAPTATDEKLRQALEVVDALTWVDHLPEGINSDIGSGGQTLTPAQSQQLALARLVLLDPHTLVLDEATSLLDPGAARHLERSLSAVLKGRTVVAIAHRLHTAHDADRVAVVDGGVITELGTHDELVAAGGDYAKLWASWHT